MRDLLDDATLAQTLKELDGWSGDSAGIRRTVTAPSFRAAVGLIGSVADVAEELDHHPDVDLRYRDVTFALSTHSAGGVTEMDVALARRIDALARELA